MTNVIFSRWWRYCLYKIPKILLNNLSSAFRHAHLVGRVRGRRWQSSVIIIAFGERLLYNQSRVKREDELSHLRGNIDSARFSASIFLSVNSFFFNSFLFSKFLMTMCNLGFFVVSNFILFTLHLTKKNSHTYFFF